MKHTISLIDDYIDGDVAYILGMVMVRGEFQEYNSLKTLLINFPYQLMKIQGLPGGDLEFNQENEIKLSLGNVRNKLEELLGTTVSLEAASNIITLKANFFHDTVAWRDLKLLTDNKTDYREFEVPNVIFNAPIEIQKEFIRGIADASSSPSYADRDQVGKQRIVIQFANQNWVLPIQVCKLLQKDLNVNVQHILWGHPNVRSPNEEGSNWAKEHRMRIYAEEFAKIGFNFKYKQDILDEFISFNSNHQTKKCNPCAKNIRNQKPSHADEISDKLPVIIRGKHFDAAFKICLALGCDQCVKEESLFEEENTEDI